MKPVLTILWSLAMLLMMHGATQPTDVPPRVRSAHLVYGGGKTGVCFASGYLDLLARETEIDIERKAAVIDMNSDAIFDYPFSIMSGEDDFVLRNDEVEQLRAYLTRGGFVLASAGCSNKAWADAFRREIQRVFPELKLRRIDPSHEIFRTVFEIRRLQTKTATTEATQLWGLTMDRRLVLVFSPEGLNDTGNAGGGCCCCGGNEIRNAKYLNANLLAYVLAQ